MTRDEQTAVLDDIGLLLTEAEGIADIAHAYADLDSDIYPSLGICIAGIGHMVKIARLRLLDLTQAKR